MGPFLTIGSLVESIKLNIPVIKAGTFWRKFVGFILKEE
jgi:hypothetical protein